MRASLAALLLIACVPPGPLRSGGTSGPDLIAAGANVPLRSDGAPEPERCPQDALNVMQALELEPGHSNAKVELDANQMEREPLTLIEPCVLVGAGVRPGSYGDVEMVDVAPTVATILGTNIPATNQGHSLFQVYDFTNSQVDDIKKALSNQQAELAQA
jgi:hypothetical protein